MKITNKAPGIKIHKDPRLAVVLGIAGAAADVAAVSDEVLAAASALVGTAAGVLSASGDVAAGTAGVAAAATAGVADSFRERAGSRRDE